MLVSGQSLLHLHRLNSCLLFARLCVALLGRIIMSVMVAHLRDARHTVHAWYVHHDLVLERLQVLVVLLQKINFKLVNEIWLIEMFSGTYGG